jgi:hypothetical protein
LYTLDPFWLAVNEHFPAVLMWMRNTPACGSPATPQTVPVVVVTETGNDEETAGAGSKKSEKPYCWFSGGKVPENDWSSPVTRNPKSLCEPEKTADAFVPGGRVTWTGVGAGASVGLPGSPTPLFPSCPSPSSPHDHAAPVAASAYAWP